MNGVNKTLYIPLYGKAYVSRKGIFLDDKKAEEILETEAFALKGKSKSKWLAYYMGIRSAVFDNWLRQQIAYTKEAVVISAYIQTIELLLNSFVTIFLGTPN